MMYFLYIDLAKPILAFNKIGFGDGKMTTLQIGPPMGDITFERGEYEMFDKDKKVIDKGKWVIGNVACWKM